MIVGVKSGSIRLAPQAYERPLILVGPGTGVAPMRAILEERAATRRDEDPKAPCHLYFGCRKRNADFLYEAEWSARQRDGSLDKIFTAFSRDQPSKVYVQTRLRENAAKVWELLFDRQGTFVVAGGSKMASDIREFLVELISKKLEIALVDAKKRLRALERERRFQTESWS